RAVVERPAREEQDGEGDERDRREEGGEDDQRDSGQDDLEAAADDLDQRLADELRQRLHVRGQPGDQDARPLALEEAEWKRLQLVERGRPQRSEEALAGTCGQQRLRANDERLRRRQAEEDDRRGVERAVPVLRDA